MPPVAAYSANTSFEHCRPIFLNFAVTIDGSIGGSTTTSSYFQFSTAAARAFILKTCKHPTLGISGAREPPPERSLHERSELRVRCMPLLGFGGTCIEP